MAKDETTEATGMEPEGAARFKPFTDDGQDTEGHAAKFRPYAEGHRRGA